MRLPVIRNTPLKLTKRGYSRQLAAKRKGGPQQKFLLGFDAPIAAQKRKWIEEIYLENCRMVSHFFWTETFLGLARQIEKTGLAVVDFTPNPEFADAPFTLPTPDVSWVCRLREVGVRITVKGKATATVPVAGSVTDNNRPAKTRMRSALMSYREERVRNYAGCFQGAKRLEGQINKFIELLPDCWLHEFGFAEIKQHVDYWRNRPTTKRENRCAKTYAENQIDEFYSFLNDCEHRYPDEFSLPNLKVINRKVINLPSDARGNAIEGKSWEPGELHEVFKTAQPMTKLILGLGLNACSGPAELGRIRVEDFHLGKVHPKARIIGFKDKQDWLITVRRKSFTHSEAMLWPWVSNLVQRQIEICRMNGWPYLFTEDGEPMYRDNAMYEELGLPLPNTTKPESRFVGRYNNSVGRALEDKRIDRKLSIGKLRKTFSNYLALQNHGDLASLALAHKTDEDNLLKCYANKPYARLFRATISAQKEWWLP